MQVIGVGSQDNFKEAQEFLGDTGVPAEGEGLTMLWEGRGNIWGLNNIRANSAMQLFSFDLSNESQVIFFNDNGRTSVLSAMVQEPWAPPGAPQLSN